MILIGILLFLLAILFILSFNQYRWSKSKQAGNGTVFFVIFAHSMVSILFDLLFLWLSFEHKIDIFTTDDAFGQFVELMFFGYVFMISLLVLGILAPILMTLAHFLGKSKQVKEIVRDNM